MFFRALEWVERHFALDFAVVYGIGFIKSTCSDLQFLLSPPCSAQQFLSPFKVHLEDHTGCFRGLTSKVKTFF